MKPIFGLHFFIKVCKLDLNKGELDIKEGEKVFLYGPSGHGKITLLNILTEVLEVTNGLVKVLGNNLQSISQSSRHVFTLLIYESSFLVMLGCIFGILSL
jgi:ABC-type lipoprotein export system ATPase subunit